MLNPIVEILKFRVKTAPNSMAIMSDKGSLTYGNLVAQVRRIAVQLRTAGIVPGQVVITSFLDRQLDWLVTLALIHEACITCSNHGYSSLDTSIGFDWEVSDRAPLGQSGVPHIHFDLSCLSQEQKVQADFLPLDYASKNDIIRLVLTSGTGGIRKAVGLNFPMIEQRFRQRQLTFGRFGQEYTFLPICTISGMNSAFHALFTGAPFLCLSGYGYVIQAINLGYVSFVSATPFQLSQFLRFISDQKIVLNKLKAVASGGGKTSPLLLQNIYTHLSDKFLNYYGSTEAGGVCLLEMNQHVVEAMPLGFSIPGCEVEVVDEMGNVVPQGDVGLLRIKTPYMAHEYFKDALASEKYFREGWFYPGDSGKILNGGLVVLSGRSGEMINRGGGEN